MLHLSREVPADMAVLRLLSHQHSQGRPCSLFQALSTQTWVQILPSNTLTSLCFSFLL